MQVRSLWVVPVHSNGHLCTNGLRALITAWLNASQRSQGGVWLNRLARALSASISQGQDSVHCKKEHLWLSNVTLSVTSYITLNKNSR